MLDEAFGTCGHWPDGPYDLGNVRVASSNLGARSTVATDSAGVRLRPLRSVLAGQQ